VTNTGEMDGDEVVQLYTRDLVSSVTTYEKNLRGFERVGLKAGETKTVHFVIPSEGLSLLNRDMKRVVEPGEFKVMVGASSEDIRVDGTFTVQ
jgi:beta-glucosidase